MAAYKTKRKREQFHCQGNRWVPLNYTSVAVIQVNVFQTFFGLCSCLQFTMNKVVGEVSSQIFIWIKSVFQHKSYPPRITDAVKNWLQGIFYANSMHLIHIKFVFLQTCKIYLL